MNARSQGEKALPELISELWTLIKSYVRQETIEPLKGVGKFVAMGTAGALLIGIGVVFAAVGALRVLQAETDSAFTGNLTWVPYALVFVALLAGAGASFAAIGARRGKRESGATRSGGARVQQPARTS